MAAFTTKTFTKYDDWLTPKSAWEDVQDFIPRDKVIWEAFYGNGESGTHLSSLGFQVIHEDIDFFEHDKGDIIVSNPPFTRIPEVLERLKTIGKPFLLIMPSSKINTQYFRNLFAKEKIQIIIPKKRIQFEKLVNGEKVEGQKKACNFDCFYYCWKWNLEQDITWI
jgi:hypothetical protein